MIVDIDKYGCFQLDDAFVAPYRERPVDWGFGALSWVTYQRTYSRDGEQWWQTCRRVIEGMFTIRRIYCAEHGLAWDGHAERRFAEEAYARLFDFKWTPPGRGLWIMGTRFMYERGGAALNNCGFVSTDNLEGDFAAPFCWMFRMSMLGVGVGFDTRGAGRLRIGAPRTDAAPFQVQDSREGWHAALKRLLSAYTGNDTSLPAAWDFSRIRPKGSKLEGFGGYASGPDPLRLMLNSLRTLLDGYAGRRVDSTLIVDMMNLIGRCVVAGGIRRSAQIALGDPHDRTFLDLKADAGAVRSHRWVSNNSVIAPVGMDYSDIVTRTRRNGEPGYFWLENARAYGRMADPRNDRDAGALGCNPCVEQTLWDRELCCLVETYPARHARVDDYLRTLHLAYEYAKTVTLVPTTDSGTNAVMSRNRRLGCSMTGVVQAIDRHGYRRFMNLCERGYAALRHWDRDRSDAWRVPRSIKLTSIKPSGTVSLLAGATPGVHWPHAPYYLRRMRIAGDHPLVALCREAGYPVEPDATTESTTVIAFPMHTRLVDRSRAEVSLREKLDLAAQLQHVWSDNQVSCTATFDPDTEADELPRLLAAFEKRLKAVSFLPATRHGYEQPPYEAITADRYKTLCARLRPIQGDVPHEQELEARFCEGETCEIQAGAG